jgi:membrane protein implicated in regulation of membrane protease activity
VLVGLLGWLALAVLLVSRLPDTPPWQLPLPVGIAIPGFAAALLVLALAWARTADRRRSPEPGPVARPAPRAETPERVPVGD